MGARVALVFACGWPVNAHADESRVEAAALFDRATQAYSKRNYAVAAAAFEESYNKIPRASAIYNAGVSWLLAGSKERGANAFKIAVEKTDLGGSEGADARTKLRDLERSLGSVAVRAPVGAVISVGPLEKTSPPAFTYLTPGEHVIRVVWSDAPATARSIRVSAGERIDENIEKPASVATTNVPRDPQPPMVVQGPALDLGAGPNRDRPPRRSSTLKTVGWVLVGSGVAAGGLGTYFGVRTLDARDAFDASGQTSREDRDAAISNRTLSTVSWISAATLAGVGLGLILFSK